MPIISYPEDRPALGSFSAIDYRPPEEQEVDPGIVAELGAAWRQDNTIGSYLNNRMAGINVSERDGLTGDQVWSDIQGTPYEAHWERFADVFNRRAVSALKSQIDMETEDAACWIRADGLRLLHSSAWPRSIFRRCFQAGRSFGMSGEA